VAHGAPSSGRGMFPISANLATGRLTYGMSLTGGGGTPFDVRIYWDLQADGIDIIYQIQILVGGVNQLSTTPKHQQFFPWYDFTLERNTDYTVPPMSAANPDAFFTCIPRAWAQGPPYPPPSTPF
jgi:hypothetical protein